MSKFQPFWNLAEDAQDDSILNMYVYGQIKSSSSFFGSETDVVASKFVKDLRQHPNAQRINVFINSPGGDVFAAAAIKNQLETHIAEVHSYIDGLGASAAVGLALAGDVVHMSRSALIMVHNPATTIGGEVKDLQKGIELLEKVKTTIVAIYKKKTGLPDARLAGLMDEETWLTADEALELGFIDEIIEDEGLDIANNDDMLIVNGVMFDFSNTSNVKIGGQTFRNNVSLEKLESKLAQVKDTVGGTYVKIPFNAILDSLEDTQREEYQAHIESLITNALNDKTAEWEAERAELTNQIVELTAAAEPVVEDTSEEAIINSLPEDVRDMVLNAQREALEAKTRLAESEKALAFNAFRAEMAVYDALPLDDTHIEALHQLSLSNEENFKNITTLLKVANAAMSAGFDTIGTEQPPARAKNALEEINNAVTALRAQHVDMDYNTALMQVATTSPELYARYRDELL